MAAPADGRGDLAAGGDLGHAPTLLRGHAVLRASLFLDAGQPQAIACDMTLDQSCLQMLMRLNPQAHLHPAVRHLLPVAHQRAEIVSQFGNILRCRVPITQERQQQLLF